MNRTAINSKARKKIAQISQDNDWRWCQIQLPGCAGEANAPAHKHKRVWYYDKPDELLWDIKEWVPSCNICHSKIEHNKELTTQIFERLRP